MQFYEHKIQDLSTKKYIKLYLYHILFSNITPAGVLFSPSICTIDLYNSSINKFILCYILDTILSVLIHFINKNSSNQKSKSQSLALFLVRLK